MGSGSSCPAQCSSSYIWRRQQGLGAQLWDRAAAARRMGCSSLLRLCSSTTSASRTKCCHRCSGSLASQRFCEYKYLDHVVCVCTHVSWWCVMWQAFFARNVFSTLQPSSRCCENISSSPSLFLISIKFEDLVWQRRCRRLCNLLLLLLHH